MLLKCTISSLLDKVITFQLTLIELKLIYVTIKSDKNPINALFVACDIDFLLTLIELNLPQLRVAIIL